MKSDKKMKKMLFANSRLGGILDKNAFTLIELLAIIVILAIIAVITVPIILNIIENSRKGAATDSAYGFKDAINKTYVQMFQTHNDLKLNDTYTVENGVLKDGDFNDSTITTLPVSTSGTIPTSGSLTYSNNVLTTGCLTIGDYKVTFNGNEATTEKGECAANENNLTQKDARQVLITKSQNDITGNELVAVSHSATAQTSATTDYRYMGATPNNYIYFNCSSYDGEEQNDTNCEIWRIIGIVDGKIKIIRNDSIGNYAWDNNSSIANYQSYNEWSKATLKTYLNSNYYTNTITSATKNLNLISSSIWYLGGLPSSSITAEQAYQYERGNAVYGCGSDEDYSGNGDDYYCVTRSTSLPSIDIQDEIYVGLIYPSDYGFASNVCYMGIGQQNMYDYDGDTCKDSNWLYKGGVSVEDTEWLLSPNSEEYNHAFTLSYDGYVEEMGSSLDQTFKVRPSVYLDSNIELVGTGEDTNPYKIIK